MRKEGSLSHTQKNRLLYLNGRPGNSGVLHTLTGEALVEKGYVVFRGAQEHPTDDRRWQSVYTLTQAGIRYCQTGKQIGE